MPSISNPASTGGAGEKFESKIQASFIVSMIAEGPCPLNQSNEKIKEIYFQTRRKGFQTDDLLIKTRTSEGTERKILCQIKISLQFTKSNEQFKKTLIAAWDDFNSDSFSRENDAIAIITGPLSSSVISHFRPTLEWARTSGSSESFSQKVNASNFSSDHKRKFIQDIKEILTEERNSVDDDLIWSFLCALYLLSYDFQQEEGKILHILNLIKSPNSISEQEIWMRILKIAGEYNINGGEIFYSNLNRVLPAELRKAFSQSPKLRASGSLQRLEEHSQTFLSGITDEFAPQVSLKRTNIVDGLIDKLEQQQRVIITGEAGGGKSVIIKHTTERLRTEGWSVFAFRIEEFFYPNLHQAFTAMGVNDDIQDITARLGLLPRCLFIIDSVERLFENLQSDAFTQLLQTINANPNWRIALVCRSENINNLYTILPDNPDLFQVPRLTTNELNEVTQQKFEIKSILADDKIKKIAQTPFYLKLICDPSSHSEFSSEAHSPQQIKQDLWRHIVEKPTEQLEGMPQRRIETLIQIALKRARNMQIFIRIDEMDPGAIQCLLNDGLIGKSQNGTYSLIHDLFEDGALYEHIDRCFDDANGEWSIFFNNIGTEPAILRAFRNWLTDSISEERANVYRFAIEAFENSQTPEHWKTEIIVGILRSETRAPDKFIQYISPSLLENNKQLFRSLVKFLRVACKGPNKQKIFQQYLDLDPMLKQFWNTILPSPVGRGWEAIIHFISSHLERFDLEESGIVQQILSDWVDSLDQNKPLPPEAVDCFKISLKYLIFLTEENSNIVTRNLDERYLKIILKIPHAAKSETQKLYQAFIDDAVPIKTTANHPLYPKIKSMFKRDRLLAKQILKWDNCMQTCVHFPEILFAVLNYTANSSDLNRDRSYLDMEQYFGLNQEMASDFDFFPASAIQGPFFQLFKFHPQKTIEFLIKFFNKTCEFYAASTLDGTANPPKTILKVDGMKRAIYANSRLWLLYRGTHVAPNILQSALMALESYLFDQAEKEEDISPWIKQIFKKTNSVATIAPLVSVALAHPNAFGEYLLPLLATPEFYILEQERCQKDQIHISNIGSLMGFPKNPLKNIFYDERKKSDEKQHRKNNLSNLMLNTQLSNLKDHAFQIIDEMKSDLQKIPYGTDRKIHMQFLLKNIDLREFSPPEKTEDGQWVIKPQNITAEMQKKSDEAQKDLSDMMRVFNLYRWGENAFRPRETEKEIFDNWRNALIEERRIQNLISKKQVKEETENTWWTYCPSAWVAARLIRFHEKELNMEEIQWCIKTALNSLEDQIDSSTPGLDMIHGSRAVALILPLILDICHTEDKDQIRSAIIKTLTAGNNSIRDHAIEGIRTWLWDKDKSLAKKCFHGSLQLTQARIQQRDTQSLNPLLHANPQYDYMAANLEIRNKLMRDRDGAIGDIDIASLELTPMNFWDIVDALCLVPVKKVDDAYIQIIANVLKGVVQNENIIRNADKLYGLFAKLIMRLGDADTPNTKLLETLQTICQQNSEVATDILTYILEEEDRKTEGEKLWNIWNVLSEIILKEKTYYRLIRAFLFTEIPWKEEIKSWEPLKNHPDIIYHAFTTIGHTIEGFAALLQMTNTIGRFLLPEVLVEFDKAWQKAANNAHNLSENYRNNHVKENLESILRYCILSQRAKILSNTSLRQAAMNLLTRLVDQGSATAYQLREIMVSP